MSVVPGAWGRGVTNGDIGSSDADCIDEVSNKKQLIPHHLGQMRRRLFLKLVKCDALATNWNLAQ
jgi:hypothetical protein